MNIKLNLTDTEVELLMTALNEASYQSAVMNLQGSTKSDNFDALYDKLERMLRIQLNQHNKQERSV